MQDEITFALAVLGSVLGAINLWRAFDRDRIRLKVVPRVYHGPTTNSGKPGLCVEVINLGYMPVTVRQIAFDIRKPRGQFFWFKPMFLNGESLPHRLEPRASVTAYVVGPADQNPILREATRAFAETACGRKFTGVTPSFRSYIEQLRPARKRAKEPTHGVAS
jgi:hypothetical protein